MYSVRENWFKILNGAKCVVLLLLSFQVAKFHHRFCFINFGTHHQRVMNFYKKTMITTAGLLLIEKEWNSIPE